MLGTRYAAEPKATAATAANALLGLGPALTASSLPLTDVMVMDITDLAHPRFAAELPLILPDGSPTECHKIELDASETPHVLRRRQTLERGRPTDVSPRTPSGRPRARPSGTSRRSHAATANPVAHFVGQSSVKGQGGHGVRWP